MVTKLPRYFNGVCDCCGERKHPLIDDDTGDYTHGSFVYRKNFDEFWCSKCANGIYEANSEFPE